MTSNKPPANRWYDKPLAALILSALGLACMVLLISRALDTGSIGEYILAGICFIASIGRLVEIASIIRRRKRA